MEARAVNKVRKYISQGNWQNYLVILPTPQLVEKFIDLLLNDEVAGILYPKIYTFEGWVEDLLNTQGAGGSYMEDIYRQEMLKIIINKLQKNGQLKYIQSPVRYSVINYIGEAIVELKQSCITPRQFSQAAGSLNDYRVSDLAVIYEQYAQELENRALKDREDRFLKVLEILTEEKELLKEVEYIYADWFFGNTPVQDKIFAVLKKRIREAEIGDNTNNPLYPLQAAIYNERAAEGEVGRVLEEVIRLLERGVLPDDIAIVARNPQVYAQLLIDYFTKINVLVDLELKKPLVKSPLIKALMMWLEIAGNHKQSFPLTILLNNHYLAGSISNQKQLLGWLHMQSEHTIFEWISLWETEKEELTISMEKGYEEVRNILENTARQWSLLTREGLAKDILASIINMVDSLNMEEKIRSFSKEVSLQERMQLNYRESQALSIFKDILNNLKKAGEDSKQTTTLRQVLNDINEYMRDLTYIAKKRPGKGISVFAPTEIRGLKFHTVLVLGMEQGQFPKRVTQNLLLRDNERVRLKPYFDLPLTADIYLREKMLFLMVLQAASEIAIFTYPGSDEEGQPNLTSLFIEDILELFPNARDFKPYLPTLDNLETSPFLKHLLKVENHRNSTSYSPYEGCFKEEKFIQMIREQTINKAFTISSLNEYAKCPMKYFLVAELGLREKKTAEASVSKADLGSIKHEVLAAVFAKYGNQEPEDLGHLIAEELELVCQNRGYTGSEYPHLWLWELEKRRITASLTILVATEMKRSSFVPYRLEWHFGFKTPFFIENRGEKFFFKGVIDRIDTDGNGHFALYDYKESASMTRQDIIAGKELQLPLYIMAVEQLIGEVAGTSYIEIKNNKLKNCFYREEYQDPLGFAAIKAKGWNRDEWQGWLQKIKDEVGSYINNISEGKFPPIPYSCLYCHLQDICLYQPAKIRDKNRGPGGIK